MRKLLLLLAAAISFCVCAQTPKAPEIAARSYMLFDVTANQILAEKNIDSPVEPAEMTKLMTAYIVFDALKNKKLELKQTLPVSEKAWKTPGSRMFIDPKMRVPVEDLLKGLIVQSGNDASVALAEGVGGTVERFVEMMNEQAKLLGMKSSQFKNPEGLTEAGHTTTARDLNTLATRLIQDFPNDVGYYAMKKYHYPGTPAANENNRNLLLYRDPTVDGLEAGYTNASGYCLIATAKRDAAALGRAGAVAGSPESVGARRLVSIVLGAVSENARANESQKLLNWGYTAFEPVKLFEANQAVVSPPVWKGSDSVVKLGQPHAIVVAVPTGSAAKVKTQVVRSDPLVAPIKKGHQLGTLKISNGEQALLDVPLIAIEGIQEAGLLGRTWDAIRLWIK